MDKIIKNNNTYVQYDPNVFNNFSEKLFNIDYITKKGLIKSTIDGRGKTFVLNYNNEEYVLKHYIRGGIVSKLSYDKYILNSLASTRSLKEYNFLNIMHKKKLPVPKPAALQVTMGRFTYQADLITCNIKNQGTLYKFVKENRMTQALWNSLSYTLDKFFQENVYHSDLNAKNIIINENKFFLLDFDNSYFFYNKKMFTKSINRLERSLKKIKNYNNEFNDVMKKFY